VANQKRVLINFNVDDLLMLLFFSQSLASRLALVLDDPERWRLHLTKV
jgi:hypothetical protein